MRIHIQIHMAVSIFIGLATACTALILCLTDFIQYYISAGDGESMSIALFIPVIMALIILFGILFPLSFIVKMGIRTVTGTVGDTAKMNTDIPSWLPLLQIGLFTLLIIGMAAFSMFMGHPISEMSDIKPYICVAMLEFGTTMVCSYWIKQIWSIYNDYVGDEEDDYL